MPIARAVFLLALTLSTAISADAAPTARTTSGTTTINFGSAFSRTVRDLGIGVSLAAPGRQRDGLIRFPIRIGQFDTETLQGELIHEGGLRFTNGKAAVDLLNYTLEVNRDVALIRGTLRINNSIVSRVPLFALTIKDPIVQRYGRFLNFPVITMTMRPELASILNDTFDTRVFNAASMTGTASVSARLSYNFTTRSVE